MRFFINLFEYSENKGKQAANSDTMPSNYDTKLTNEKVS